MQHFIAVKQSGDGRIDTGALAQVADKLMLIGDFIKYCSGMSERLGPKDVNPLLPIFTELWPFIELVLAEFIESDEIIEFLCRLVKHS